MDIPPFYLNKKKINTASHIHLKKTKIKKTVNNLS